MIRQLSRQAIRALLEDHIRRQFQAEQDGCWYAVQNDINDELAEHRADIAAAFGVYEAERFWRIYVEEQLAFERDMRRNPQAGARRMMGGEPFSQALRPAVAQIEYRPVQPAGASPWASFFILIIVGAAALLF